MLVTHLPPAAVLKLTPDQSGVILEEYSAMNSSGEPEAKPVDLGQITGTANGMERPMMSAEQADGAEENLGARVRAEMKASIAASAKRAADGR